MQYVFCLYKRPKEVLKNISEKKFLNYFAVKNDVHDVKGTASDFSPPLSDCPLVPILSSEAAARGCDVY